MEGSWAASTEGVAFMGARMTRHPL